MKIDIGGMFNMDKPITKNIILIGIPTIISALGIIITYDSVEKFKNLFIYITLILLIFFIICVVYYGKLERKEQTECDNLKSKNKELQNKVNKIMESYPNLQLLFEDDRVMSLNEEECKMLQKLVSLHLQISEYEDRKIFFLGARENYFYFKNLGIIKE